jgi:hypothetical protein
MEGSKPLVPKLNLKHEVQPTYESREIKASAGKKDLFLYDSDEEDDAETLE